MKVQPRDIYRIPYAPIENNSENGFLVNDEVYQEEDYDIYGRLTRPLDEGDDMKLLYQVDNEGEIKPLEMAKEVESCIRKKAGPTFNDDFINDNETDEEENEYVNKEHECGSSTSNE